jgi:uncharacterized protein (TIGR02217 family)
MAFLEIEFPRNIAYQAMGGPGWFTTVNKGFSGFEQTNQNWALPLGKWKIALDHKAFVYFCEVRAMWLQACGRAKSFRFYDLLDCQATNEPCTLVYDSPFTGCVYQLTQSYAGALSSAKPILKPITALVQKFDGTYCSNTVSIFVSGSQASNWNLDYTTGLLTFNSPPGVSPAVPVTWTGQYHFPVRFDMDDCNATIEPSDSADGNALVTWPDVVLVEKRIQPSI